MSLNNLHVGGVAQLGERRVRNAKVGSSILLLSTKEYQRVTGDLPVILLCFCGACNGCVTRFVPTRSISVHLPEPPIPSPRRRTTPLRICVANG